MPVTRLPRDMYLPIGLGARLAENLEEPGSSGLNQFRISKLHCIRI
jgi:hypothetical protein